MKHPSPIPSPMALSKSPLTDLLVRAVDQLDVTAFHAVLSRTLAIDAPSSDGRTPYTAVLDALQECLKDPDATRRVDILVDMARPLKALGARDYRCLLDAAAAGNLPEVKRLIRSGVPLNFSVISSGTALDVAIKGGHRELVLFLRLIGGVDLLPSPSLLSPLLNELKRLAALDSDLASEIVKQSTEREMTRVDPNPFLIRVLKSVEAVCSDCQIFKADSLCDILDRLLLDSRRWEYRRNVSSAMITSALPQNL